MAKFLDDNGLSAVWAKIKEFCAGLMAATVYDPAGKSSQVETEEELEALPVKHLVGTDAAPVNLDNLLEPGIYYITGTQTTTKDAWGLLDAPYLYAPLRVTVYENGTCVQLRLAPIGTSLRTRMIFPTGIVVKSPQYDYVMSADGALTSDLNMNERHKIIGLPDPTNITDAATKRYVDETTIPKLAKYYPANVSPDIDTLTDALMLVPKASTKGCPVSGSFVYIMQIFYQGTSAQSARTQIAWPHSSTNSEAHGVAVRTYSTSTMAWSAWEKVYTDAAKPTAADVGARPSTWKPTPSDIVREGYTAAGLDPIAAAMIGAAASNKSFGLPAEAITIEYSNDGGATWEDYGASSSVKFALFAELRDSPIYLGKRSATVAADPANAQTTDSMLRVTIVPSDRYVSFNSIYCWLSTAGNKCQAKIESSTIGEKTTFSELKGWTTVSGWAGSNIIYFRSGTFGGGESQPTNHYAYRVTFRNTSINAVSGNAYINDIRFLGVDAWASPNNMVGRNRLYKWDALLNAIFERSVSGEQLISRAAEGTPPLVVGSSTAVPKLNADLLDGKHAGDFASIARSATQPTGQRPGDYWDEILT